MPYLTLFTAPKPFSDGHIALIQRNAIRSWLALGGDVQVLLVGDEPGMAETAAELGVTVLSDVQRNAQGTPLLNSIFALARGASNSPLLAYVNADILLLPDFVSAARQIAAQARRFLVVGQRWDMEINRDLDFVAGWAERLRDRIAHEGRLHPPAGSDYFIFPRECFTDMPPFAVGRAGWDNWMIYKARREGWPVVDASGAINIVHQDHDYRHLPGGQPHYRLPETFENVRLAGGRRTIFHLRDADRRFAGGRLQRLPLTWERLWREVEIFPLVRLHSMRLGQLAFALFHPQKAYQEMRRNQAQDGENGPAPAGVEPVHNGSPHGEGG